MTSTEFIMQERNLDQVRAAAPESDLRVIRGRDSTPADIQWADVIFGFAKQHWVNDAPRVRWLHLPSAGAEGWVGLRPEVVLTNSSGAFGIPIAEWAIGTMLMLSRNLHLYRDRQRQAPWKPIPGAREIWGRTVGVVGLGDLGGEVARRARALGCRVLGARRRPHLAGRDVDALLPLDEMLPQVDFLVLALPSTPETRGMISAERLARLKAGAYLINVGRGNTVDESAMIEALRSGHLAGAALDVTAVEPLPPESPLWQMEQVILTPHVSSRSPEANADRRYEIFCDNLRRFQSGEPLRNLVNREAGY